MCVCVCVSRLKSNPSSMRYPGEQQCITICWLTGLWHWCAQGLRSIQAQDVNWWCHLDLPLSVHLRRTCSTPRWRQSLHREQSKGDQHGSWNVRSLLDCEGAVETARQRTETGHFDDKRIDQVMRELERYRITVAALQETKWFGEAVYKVGKSIVLAAGRPTPLVGEPRQRDEGVAITLSGPAVKAWKAGGEQWKAWSSRLVTATLQPGRANSDRIHILSCYAPTFAASRRVPRRATTSTGCHTTKWVLCDHGGLQFMSRIQS